MDNSINFKGAFLIHKPSNTLVNNLLPILGKPRQVIENVTHQDSVLFVVKNKFDKGIVDVLEKHKDVKFEYYPSLNIKSGFNKKRPAEAARILQIAEKNMISAPDIIKNFIKSKIKVKPPVDIDNLHISNLKTIQQNIGIDITGNNYRTNINHKNGICSVYLTTKNKKACHPLISITPPDKYGISYTQIIPETEIYKTMPDKTKVRNLAVKNGEVIFEYKDSGLDIFLKNQKAAKKYYVDSMKKYKAELAASKAD